MTVLRFPKRPIPAHLQHLKGYDRAAAQRGVRTMAIEISEAEKRVKERLRAILELDELQVFGQLNNALSRHFAFTTNLSVDEVRGETIAIRSALAEIGIPGMALDPQETPSND